jgi:hypothetical protein
MVQDFGHNFSQAFSRHFILSISHDIRNRPFASFAGCIDFIRACCPAAKHSTSSPPPKFQPVYNPTVLTL